MLRFDVKISTFATECLQGGIETKPGPIIVRFKSYRTKKGVYGGGKISAQPNTLIMNAVFVQRKQ